MIALTPNEAAALAELEACLLPQTPEQIATRLGCTARHVRRLEAKALMKLRDLLAGTDWGEGLREPPLLSQRVLSDDREDDQIEHVTGMTRRKRIE